MDVDVGVGAKVDVGAVAVADGGRSPDPGPGPDCDPRPAPGLSRQWHERDDPVGASRISFVASGHTLDSGHESECASLTCECRPRDHGKR